jgi:hypothetical protein
MKSLRAIYEKDKFAFGDALQELSVREARIEKMAQLVKHGISAQVHVSEGNHNAALESAVGLLQLSKDLEIPKKHTRALEAIRSLCESMFTENFKDKNAISEMPRKEYRKALDSLLQSSRDNPEAIKLLPAATMEFMEIYKVMQEAMQNDNHDLAHLQVDKLLEFNKKYTIHFIKGSDLEELQTLTIRSRDWKRAQQPCRDAVSSQRFRDLPSLLADLTIQHTSGAFPGITHAELAHLDSELSTATWNALMRLWETAFDLTDYTACLTHLSTMQSLQDLGVFAAVDTSDLGPTASILAFLHLKTTHRVAAKKYDYKSAIAIANTLLAQFDTPTTWLSPAHLDKEKSAKWYFQAEVRQHKFAAAWDEADFIEAKKHFDVMLAMVKRPPKYVERERLGNIWRSEELGAALEVLGTIQRGLEEAYGKKVGRRAVREIKVKQQGEAFGRPMREIMGLPGSGRGD